MMPTIWDEGTARDMLSQALRTAVADSDVRLRYVLAHATTQCRLEHLWQRMLPSKLQLSYQRNSFLSRHRAHTSASSNNRIAIVWSERFAQAGNVVSFKHLSQLYFSLLTEACQQKQLKVMAAVDKALRRKFSHSN